MPLNNKVERNCRYSNKRNSYESNMGRIVGEFNNKIEHFVNHKSLKNKS